MRVGLGGVSERVGRPGDGNDVKARKINYSKVK